MMFTNSRLNGRLMFNKNYIIKTWALFQNNAGSHEGMHAALVSESSTHFNWLNGKRISVIKYSMGLLSHYPILCCSVHAYCFFRKWFQKPPEISELMVVWFKGIAKHYLSLETPKSTHHLSLRLKWFLSCITFYAVHWLYELQSRFFSSYFCKPWSVVLFCS